VTRVAVIAHRNKSFGGGLPELRRLLSERGIANPIWYEVDKSRQAPKKARKALRAGADLFLVWGGDGTVQRCIDVLAGTKAAVAILPAGTANLLATNMNIPQDLAVAVDIGLGGATRKLDVGRINGECFAVMAGIGFDAMMIADADGGLKDRLGRSAYLWTGARNIGTSRMDVRVDVDGHRLFRGRASCVLVGNVGKVLGGIEAFESASPEDGLLEIGVVDAMTPVQWTRLLAKLALGRVEKSKYVTVGCGKRIDLRLDHKMLYELDGGDREKTKRVKIRVEPAALTLCVPKAAA
jgi:YegS/Rv2252/BmrU family lipid kinase